MEERIKLKETERLIDHHWPDKLYADYSNEIKILHAGINSKTWKAITEVVRDIKIVKNNWIKELESFERFVTEVKRKWFTKKTLDKYHKKYISDYVSFIKSHLWDKKLENILDKIKNDYMNKKSQQFVLLKNFIIKLL